MLDTTAHGALAALVADLERALVAQDADAVADLFLETGFWRDLAAFTWNLKTLEGRGQIAAMARAQLPKVAPKALALDPAVTQAVLQQVRQTVGDLSGMQSKPVLIVSMDIRRYVRKLIESDYYGLPVLSYQELTQQINIQPLGRIAL